MTVPKEDDVRRIINPDREAKFWRAIHQAWADIAPDRPKYGRWPRTRANMMFEREAVRLQEEFNDDTGVHFYFHDETVKITIDDAVLARCKKSNNQGFGQNVPTQAVLAFCEVQEDLPGLPGLQKVEILYGVDPTGTEISGIVVQARDGDMRLWAYPLRRPESGAAGVVVPLPMAPAPMPPTIPSYDADDLVSPRKTPVPEEETDKE